MILTTKLASGHRVKAHAVLVRAHTILVSTVCAHTLLVLTVDLAQRVGVVHAVVAQVTWVRLVATPTAMTSAVVTAHVVVAVHVTSKAHHTAALMSTVVAVSTAATTAAATSSTRVVVLMTATHLLTLELGLDTLAVGSVSDHGQDGSNAFHKL